MVATRSMRLEGPQPRRIQKNESPRHRESPPGGARSENKQPEDMKDSKTDDLSDADSKALLQDPPTVKAAKSRSRSNLVQTIDPVTDGEVSEAESTCSYMSGLQEPTVRVTRRRRIIIPCQPESKPRSRHKTTRSESIKSGDEGEVSESESCSSVLSSLLASPVRTRRARQRETRFHVDSNSALLAEETSDAESWCSGVSSIGSRRTTRSKQIKLKKEAESQSEGEDNTPKPENVNQSEHTVPSQLEIIFESTCVNTQSSNTEQPAPSLGNRSNQCKNEIQGFGDKSLVKSSEEKPEVQMRRKKDAIAEEFSKGDLSKSYVVEEKKETNSKGLQQSTFKKFFTSQSQSTPDKTKAEHKKTATERISEAFVLLDGCLEGINEQNEKAEDLEETNDVTLTEITDNENSDCKVSVIEDTYDKKEHLNGNTMVRSPSVTMESQDNNNSGFLVLSSDEEQVSEDSENEEDTLCFVESSEQKLSSEKNSEDNLSKDLLFVIDKTPGLNSDKNYYLEEEEEKTSEIASEQENDEEESEEEEPIDKEENEEEFIDEDDLLSNTKSNLLKLSSSSIDPGLSIKQLGGLYINFNAEKMNFNKNALTQIKEKNKKELLQKSIITPDFEKKDCIPPYKESQFQLKKKRREERKKTAGDGWFGMKAPELTTELKNDLKALQMRASMDPKRFYKKNDRDGFPKYFQVGTIVDSPADFYHSRIPKKQRKRTIVEELLADSEFRRYNKRKYTEIMMEKAANAAGKKFRKKKKFRN
ncbi:deoxynucleotidyltransferase terminal-interacting protein 2 isoform X1 [Monodelphis domestica]|uniref:deoxynucleotidyltransferase terminal-interacting protein 2 isoform X1 n=2 Tax=Monodelphis domestica TaxID=13616 RepID=UPI0024E262F1|nr:deoxynucleotidyltransferase terminal-interacting protein 2 isoform X1 [Monodelphis domestica]